MLSSLSLCIPREWSLHCSALSGPFATTGSGKRLLVRQLEVWYKGVPFRGRTRGGESERGRRVNILREGPLLFWSQFGEKVTTETSMENGQGKSGLLEDCLEVLQRMIPIKLEMKTISLVLLMYRQTLVMKI